MATWQSSQGASRYRHGHADTNLLRARFKSRRASSSRARKRYRLRSASKAALALASCSSSKQLRHAPPSGAGQLHSRSAVVIAGLDYVAAGGDAAVVVEAELDDDLAGHALAFRVLDPAAESGGEGWGQATGDLEGVLGDRRRQGWAWVCGHQPSLEASAIMRSLDRRSASWIVRTASPRRMALSVKRSRVQPMATAVLYFSRSFT